MNGEVSGAGEGRASRATAAATSLIRPLTDWASGFRLNLWPAAAAAAAEVVGRRVTFDPLLYSSCGFFAGAGRTKDGQLHD